MSEYKMKFPRGTWVKGVVNGIENYRHALLTRMDENDGEHWVVRLPETADPAELADYFDYPEHGFWVDTNSLAQMEEDTAPEWIGGNASHAFVYEWMDDHVANVSLHASPGDIVDAYFTDADEEERRSLQTKLMEAVMDPGERIEMVPGGGAVRFCVVNG